MISIDTTIDLPQRIQNIYDDCTDEEKQYLIQILEELSEYGYSETYKTIWLADYKEIPVDIMTFISNDAYLGKVTREGKAVYPAWKVAMQEIFGAGNQYDEVFFTGATRIGKSSTAITCMAYMLYKLMCLRDPQKYFGKKEVSKFSILFFNITKDLAKGVAYREFNDTLKESPWFNEHGSFSRSDKDFYYIPEGGKIDIDFGSSGVHGLGKQIFAAMADEANFAKSGIKDVNKAKRDMKDTFNTISARIKGTFRMNGQVMGKLFGVSSKKSDSDFMEDYIQTQRNSGQGDHMYVVDRPQWEILPPSMFKKEKFYVAVGDRYKRGFVVPDNQTHEDALEELKEQGYLLITPPIDMKSEFIADFDIALRDLAGISVPGALSFITQESLDKCINKSRRNPFYTDILQIGTQDGLTIEQFFHVENIADLKRYPMYIHFDLSLNTDRTGISGNCITGRKDILDDSKKVVSMPSFTHAFSVSLEAPKGDKIPYAKILQFTIWLRKQGFNIKITSRDQFQSEYLGQLLTENGFTDKKISLDRTPDGYITCRSILLEERIDMLDVAILQDELIHLQRDSVTGRVDHPVGGGKDVSDSFAGSLWCAILDSPGVTVPVRSVANVISKVNGPRNTNVKSSDLTSMFQDLYNNPNKRKR